jgi:hypothetical protein
MHASIFIFTLHWGIAYHSLRFIVSRISLVFRTDKLWGQNVASSEEDEEEVASMNCSCSNVFAHEHIWRLYFSAKRFAQGRSMNKTGASCVSTTEYSYVRKSLFLHFMSCLSSPRNFSSELQIFLPRNTCKSSGAFWIRVRMRWALSRKCDVTKEFDKVFAIQSNVA